MKYSLHNTSQIFMILQALIKCIRISHFRFRVNGYAEAA